MSIIVAAHHKKPLLIVLEVQSVQNGWIVCGGDDLLFVPFGQFDQSLGQLHAHLWIERGVDVVNRKKRWGVFGDKEGQVKQKEEEALVGASLIEILELFVEVTVLDLQGEFIAHQVIG